MSLDRLGAQLEIKSVDQRLITGFAAAGGLDRVGDVIDMAVAFRKTLTEKRPADVGVFIGHDTASLPVGIPVEIVATPAGLKTVTRIFEGPVGDNLLAVAKGLQAAGQCLGMSIGYRVTDAKPDRVDGKSVRRLLGVDLVEFSYAARQAIANPRALVTGVKAPGTGGSMHTVEQRGDVYHVLDGTGASVGTYDSQAAAEAACAMHNGKTGGGKTVVNPNDLPDAAFLYVAPGGVADDEQKTIPRGHRRFRFRDGDGALDPAALRTALTEIPKAGLVDAHQQVLLARARTMLENVTAGKLADSSNDWEDGAPLALTYLGYQTLDLAKTVAAEHGAMRLLGDDTKDGQRMRPELRQQARELARKLTDLATWADTVDQGRDAEARLASLRHQLELLEV